MTIVTLALGGCAARPSRPTGPPVPELGSTHVVETQEIAPPGMQPVPATPPPIAPSCDALLEAANDLEVGHPGTDHALVVHALRALAAATEIVAPRAADDLLRMREAITRLDASSPDARTHARFVRIALDAAAHALGQVRPPVAQAQHYADALDMLRNFASSIDPDIPLRDQYLPVRAAIRAATRSVFAANGAPDPTFAAVTAQR